MGGANCLSDMAMILKAIGHRRPGGKGTAAVAGATGSKAADKWAFAIDRLRLTGASMARGADQSASRINLSLATGAGRDLTPPNERRLKQLFTVCRKSS